MAEVLKQKIVSQSGNFSQPCPKETAFQTQSKEASSGWTSLLEVH
jgi:hypothetical protein